MIEIFVSKKEAFQRGIEDYLNDKFYEDCPYTTQRLVAAWRMGWNTALLGEKTVKLESVVDPVRKGLSTDLFENSEDKTSKMLQSCRETILTMADEYSSYGEIKEVLLCGSMAGRQYDKDSDIDVTVVLEPNSEEDYKQARKTAIRNSYTYHLKDTEHPINLYIRRNSKISLWSNVYDIKNNKWIKQTESYSKDLSSYFSLFSKAIRALDLTKEALRRDIIDYKKLENYVSEDPDYFKERLEITLNRINRKIEALSEFHGTLKDKIKDAYNRDYTEKEMEDIIEVDTLPVNILYKLLEKYHYNKLLKYISNLTDEKDVEDVSIDRLYKTVSFQEGIRSVKGLYDKYHEHYGIIKSVVEDIISFDPTSDLSSGKAGYFSEWLIKAHINKCKPPTTGNCDFCGQDFIDGVCGCSPEDIDDRFSDCINETPNINSKYLIAYLKHKDKIPKELRDINQYETFRDFTEMIKSFGLLNRKSKKEKQRAKTQVNTIYRDKDWLLIEPLSPEANYYYSIHTKWCTTDPGTWDSYKQDAKYFILIKKKGDVKFAITAGDVWDAEDNYLEIESLMIWLYDNKAPERLIDWLENYFSSWEDEKESDIEESADPEDVLPYISDRMRYDYLKNPQERIEVDDLEPAPTRLLTDDNDRVFVKETPNFLVYTELWTPDCRRAFTMKYRSGSNTAIEREFPKRLQKIAEVLGVQFIVHKLYGNRSCAVFAKTNPVKEYYKPPSPIDKLLEITTTASVGAYDVPLGATPVGRKKRRRIRKKNSNIRVENRRIV